MTSLSLIAVPVLLDSIPSTPQLLHAWTRMYHYGHLALPTMAVGTLGLWTYTAAKKRRSSTALAAGAVTVLMIPFTWIFMTAINNELFRLEAAGSEGVGGEEARVLVGVWARWHLVRSVFPLAGAAVGGFVVLRG